MKIFNVLVQDLQLKCPKSTVEVSKIHTWSIQVPQLEYLESIARISRIYCQNSSNPQLEYPIATAGISKSYSWNILNPHRNLQRNFQITVFVFKTRNVNFDLMNRSESFFIFDGIKTTDQKRCLTKNENADNAHIGSLLQPHIHNSAPS